MKSFNISNGDFALLAIQLPLLLDHIRYKMGYRPRSFVDLPEDLQSNIFLRLPVKCVLNCKRVCKSFCTIIRNPDFTNAHLTFSRPITTETSRLIISDYTKLSYIQCHKHLLTIDKSIENTTDCLSSSPMTLPIPYVGALFLVGSCNGLICFDVRINYYTSECNFLLWNPVTRHTRYLPRLQNRSKCALPITEFGFVRETNEYMVVNVLKSYQSCNFEIELYKMSTNSWTVYCNTTVGKLISPSGQGFDLDPDATSVFSNRCFHWGTIYMNEAYIVSFNLETEELGMIKSVNDRCSYFMQWKLAVVEENLAMIYWKFTGELQIWVMTDYGIEDSWVLKFCFGNYISIMYPVGYWKNDMLIVVLEKQCGVLDLNTGLVVRIPDKGSWSIKRLCSFDESFAPVRRLL